MCNSSPHRTLQPIASGTRTRGDAALRKGRDSTPPLAPPPFFLGGSQWNGFSASIEVIFLLSSLIQRSPTLVHRHGCLTGFLGLQPRLRRFQGRLPFYVNGSSSKGLWTMTSFCSVSEEDPWLLHVGQAGSPLPPGSMGGARTCYREGRSTFISWVTMRRRRLESWWQQLLSRYLWVPFFLTVT